MRHLLASHDDIEEPQFNDDAFSQTALLHLNGVLRFSNVSCPGYTFNTIKSRKRDIYI